MSIQLINPTELYYDAIDVLIGESFERTAEAELVRNLRNNPYAYDPLLEFLIVTDNIAIAHILYTHANILQGDIIHPTLALAPVCVHKNYQKQGIGTHLITDTLNTLKEKKFESIFVLGHSAFYQRFGFRSSAEWNIQAPFPVPEGALMAYELKPAALENISGTLHYAKEFYSTPLD